MNVSNVMSRKMKTMKQQQKTSIILFQKSFKEYHGHMQKMLMGQSYFQDEDLSSEHSTGINKVLEVLEKRKNFGSPKIIYELAEKLEKKIKTAFTEIKKRNHEKREQFISQVVTNAENDFRAELNDKFPFETVDDEYKFYEVAEINRVAEQVKAKLWEAFEEKISISNERGDRLDALVKSIEGTFESVLGAHITRNTENQVNAEEKMISSIVEELLSLHRSKLKEYFTSNKFETDETAIQNDHEQEKSAILVMFQQRKKPGDNVFHKEYLTLLESGMDNNFANLMNEHKSRLQKDLLSTDKFMKQLCDEYETELREAAKTAKSENNLTAIHSTKKLSYSQKFSQEINPFPEDSQLSSELESKFNSELQKVFEKVQQLELVEINDPDFIRNKGALAENLLKVIMDHYNVEMKRFLERDIYRPGQLEGIHAKLVGRLMEIFEAPLKLTSNPDVDNADNLEKMLNQSFSAYQRQNEAKLGEVSRILETAKSSYGRSIEDEVKKHPEGLEPAELRRKHDEIFMEVKKSLETEIRKKIVQDATLEVHMNPFQEHADEEWTYFLELNDLNIKKQKLNDERERRRFGDKGKLEGGTGQDHGQPSPQEKLATPKVTNNNKEENSTTEADGEGTEVSYDNGKKYSHTANQLPSLSEAKRQLLDKCQQIKQQLEEGTVFKFKFSYTRDTFAKKIEEGLNSASEANSTRDQIKGHMKNLEELCAKHAK